LAQPKARGKKGEARNRVLSDSITASNGNGKPRYLRRLNRFVVLETLRTEPGLSRADLAWSLDLSKSTVSAIVEELIQENLIVERGFSNPGLGRPGTHLELEREHNALLGWEVGVDYLAARVFDLRGQVRTGSNLSMKRPDPSEVMNALAETTSEALQSLGNPTVHALGVAVPGPVDSTFGMVDMAPNLGWHHVPLGETLSDVLSQHSDISRVPFVLENESNACAMAVHTFFPGKARNFVFLDLGIGLGGGLILDGKLYRGAWGYGGEVGHISLDPEGPECRCGRRGCAETFINLNIWRESPSEETAISIGERLGSLIAKLANTLNPELVVLGGSLMEAIGPKLLEYSRVSLETFGLPGALRDLRIEISPYGRETAVTGAGALAIRRFFESQMEEDAKVV
jgi:predicted NBD/HSP70 family sugar kinase